LAGGRDRGRLRGRDVRIIPGRARHPVFPPPHDRHSRGGVGPDPHRPAGRIERAEGRDARGDVHRLVRCRPRVSMTLFQSFILGLLQGLAEFLPISSSAHLALAPWLFGWPEPGLPFDVALHVGTLVAVLGYFRAEWARLARAAWSVTRNLRAESPEEWRAVYLAIATVPGVIAGVLLQKQAEA